MHTFIIMQFSSPCWGYSTNIDVIYFGLAHEGMKPQYGGLSRVCVVEPDHSLGMGKSLSLCQGLDGVSWHHEATLTFS